MGNRGITMNLFLQVEKKLKVLEQKRNIEVTDDNWRDYDKF